MMWNLTSRWTVASMALAAIVSFGDLDRAAAQEKKFAGVALRVGTWGGSWRDARHELIGQKLEALGAKVEYVIGTPRDNFAKLIAARRQGDVPIDIMEISPELSLTLENMNFLEDLNYQALPNSGNVDSTYKTRTALATQVIQIGIAYNKPKFEELGLPAPTSFGDLFHPKLAGRVAMTDVNAIEAPYNLVALTMLAGGSEQNLEPGFKKLAELKPAYYYKASTDLATKFTLGEIWAAPWHAGWVIRIARGGFPIAHADVRVGDKHGIIAEEYMGILKGTKAREAAEYWINQALEPEAQIAFARKVGVVPTNAKALERMKDDPVLKTLMWRPEDQKRAFHMNWKVIEPQMPKMVDRWNRIMMQ
jgi:putative spermidine/putrescine transport system substrate-binding protein